MVESFLTDYQGIVSRLVNLTSLNIDALKVDNATYAQQFENAVNVNGGDIESATSFDYLMHFLTFGWKVTILALTFFKQKNSGIESGIF